MITPFHSRCTTHFFAALILTVSFLFPQNMMGQTIHPDYYDGTIFLKIKENAGVELPPLRNAEEIAAYPYFAELLKAFEVHEVFRPFTKVRSSFFTHTYQLTFDKIEKTDALISALEAQSIVEFAERVPIMRSYYTPNDTYANNNNQWFLSKINAYQAWDLHKEGSDVVIAIVDDAVKWDHNDLEDNLWYNLAEYFGTPGIDDDGNGYVDDIIGWDAANNDNNPAPPGYASSSEFSHGTHCAGIAAGVTNNGTGVASISFNNAKIMACKGKTDGTMGSSIDKVWLAFEYAAVNAPDIISCSWGGGGYSTVFQNLINYAVGNGSIVVAAAGNDNISTPQYPAAYNNVIAVANTKSNDQRNTGSNYGTWVDIAAPGTNILSSIANHNNAYDSFTGTSMACPLVAGMLAHMKSYKPSATNAQLVSCMYASADNINSQNPGYQGMLGAGRINAQQALICLGAGGGGGNCDDNLLTLTITLDKYGSETTWGIFQNSSLIASGGPYQDDASGMTLQENLCLPNGCYDLVFFDEYGDGMCCEYGNGGYVLKNENGNTLASGGEFLNEQVNEFCLNAGGGGNCSPPAGFHAFDIGYSFVRLDWDNLSGADKYQTRYRKVGTSAWTEGSWFTTSAVNWANMTPCTQYEFQVRSECNGQPGSFSSSLLVNTTGCDDDYCYSYGLTWDDWIARVQFANIDHETGKDYGYANYTNVTTTVEPGSTHVIRLTADTDDNSQTVYWRVWIDFNQDNDFNDPGEQIFQHTGNNTSTSLGGVTIPANAPTGTTRMRVSMDINGYPTPCATGSYRAVEDYGIIISQGPTLTISPSSKTVTATTTGTSFAVSSNVNWNIGTVSANWLTATKSGNNVNLTFSENPTSNARTAQVTVQTSPAGASKTFTLTQEGGIVPQIDLSPSNQTVTATTTGTSFAVSSNVNWNIGTVSANWLTATKSGNNVNLTFSENPTSNARTAQVTVQTSPAGASKTFTLVQEGGIIPQLNLSPSNQTVTATTTGTSFAVSSNVNWNIGTVSANWLTATKSGNNVNLTFSENPNANARTAQVTVQTSPAGASKTFTLVQEGATSNDPFLSTSAEVINLGAHEQTAIFGIEANTDWIINVASNSPWIGNINPLLGDSDETIYVPVEANNSTQQRVALLEITGIGVPNRTVTIIQAGALFNSVAEETARLPVKVFPNPAKDWLNISLETTTTAPVQVQLSDAAGRIVQTRADQPVWSGQPLRLEVSELPAGLYFVRIEQDGKVSTEKVMVVR